MADDRTRRAEAAATLCAFVTAGYSLESVNEAARANDLSLLRHPGPFSVQLQPPDDDEAPPAEPEGSQ